MFLIELNNWCTRSKYSNCYRTVYAELDQISVARQPGRSEIPKKQAAKRQLSDDVSNGSRIPTPRGDMISVSVLHMHDGLSWISENDPSLFLGFFSLIK